MNGEQEYLDELREKTRQDKDFLRTKGPKEQKIVETFLKICGIQYQKNEIKISKTEPPDIIFKEAKFEVTEVGLLDTNRKRDDEYKQMLEQLKNANKIKDLIEPYKSLPAIDKSQLKERIMQGAVNKQYDIQTKQSLDLLVYINSKLFLGYDPSSDNTTLFDEEFNNWRSVSFVMGWHAGIIYCNNTAPKFLRDLNQKGIILAQNPLEIWT